jgi:hypothetical protein
MLKGINCKPEMAMSNGWDKEAFGWGMIGMNLIIVAWMLWKTIVIGLLKKAVDHLDERSKQFEDAERRRKALQNASLVLAANTPEEIVKEVQKVKKVVVEKVPTITAGVDIAAVLRQVDIGGMVSQLLDDEELKSIARKGGIRGDCFESQDKDAVVTAVETTMMWFLDRVETQRETILNGIAHQHPDAEWPPKTIEGLRKSKESVDMAYASAGEADLASQIENMCIDDMSNIVQKKFPEYCPEVMQMKNHLRKTARALALAVTQRGIPKFKNEIERILEQAMARIKKAMEPVFLSTAKDTFDRISADGVTVCTAEELNNMITALEYKFNEYLVKPVGRQVLIDAAVASIDHRPMEMEQFLAWFNYHFRNIGDEPQLPTPPKPATMATFGQQNSSEGSSHSAETADERTFTATTHTGSRSSVGKEKLLAARKKLSSAMKAKKSVGESDDASPTKTTAAKSNAARLLMEKRQKRAAEKSEDTVPQI